MVFEFEYIIVYSYLSEIKCPVFGHNTFSAHVRYYSQCMFHSHYCINKMYQNILNLFKVLVSFINLYCSWLKSIKSYLLKSLE